MCRILGFIVARGGAKTDPEMIKTIQEYAGPTNLYTVRSLLGLANYYRVFVKDIPLIAPIEFDDTQHDAFERLRNILASEVSYLCTLILKKLSIRSAH